MNDIKAAILRLLLDKGPVYNWMKLDRALSQQGFFGNVAALVAELEHAVIEADSTGWAKMN